MYYFISIYFFTLYYQKRWYSDESAVLGLSSLPFWKHHDRQWKEGDVEEHESWRKSRVSSKSFWGKNVIIVYISIIWQPFFKFQMKQIYHRDFFTTLGKMSEEKKTQVLNRNDRPRRMKLFKRKYNVNSYLNLLCINYKFLLELFY